MAADRGLGRKRIDAVCEMTVISCLNMFQYIPEFKKQILCILSIEIIEGKCTERHSDQDSVSETGNKPEQDSE